MIYTPKQRMLNAYRDVFSDRYPVAPEFWYYYPAKVLGVSMMEFEREIPLWQALHTTFKKFGCEGWGAVFPDMQRGSVQTRSLLHRMDEHTWREETEYLFAGKTWNTLKRFHTFEPSTMLRHLADEPEDVAEAAEMLLHPEYELSFSNMNRAWETVGEDYLLEVWTGMPFTDFISEIAGFENAVLWFADEEESDIQRLWERYCAHQLEMIRRIINYTPYESYAIGCNYACTSLMGTALWRRWDKPYIKAVADLLHSRGKLLHIHFHGRSIQCAGDFAEIGIDCVCPFERGPGGDVSTMEEMAHVRKILQDRVTFNGNVHTVETLIRGNESKVREEVRQLKQVFAGSPRLIIGTGDQVGYETPEENLFAMIDEAKKNPFIHR